jgi:hypothetical protein
VRNVLTPRSRGAPVSAVISATLQAIGYLALTGLAVWAIASFTP